MDYTFEEDIVRLGDKPYELKQFYAMEGFLEEKITLGNFHSTIAEYGGPLALMRNKRKMMSNTKNQSYIDDVCFFNSQGLMINSFKIDYEGDVLCFDFLQSELLLILTNSSLFYLVDPSRTEQRVKPFRLDSKFKGIIHSAKVFKNSVVFCVKQVSPNQVDEIRFHYVENLHTVSRESSFIAEKSFAKINLKEFPRDWIVVSSDQSAMQALEIQITHPECGIISLTESAFNLYYGIIEDKPGVAQKQIPSKPQLPSIKNIQYIALSPSGTVVAYMQELSGKIKLCVLSNDYEASTYRTSEVDLKEFQLPSSLSNQAKDFPLKMYWCGDHCCVLQGGKSFLMIGPNVSENVDMKEEFVLSTEVDGLRVLTKKSNMMLRSIPPSFLNVYSHLYQSCSEENKPAAAQLLVNYENLKSKQPFDDSNLRSNLIQLKTAVSDCMTTAEFVFEEDKQQDLLKAASYGKTYIGPDSNLHDDFGHLCVKLRVVYNFKQQKTLRMITCAQVSNLLSGELQQDLINIMMRYDNHELAINVCNQLDFKAKVKTQIFEHWAERVIEKSSLLYREESRKDVQNSRSGQGSLLDFEDDRVAEKIINKLKSEENVSFVNISKRAMKEGRQNLATKLLYQEPSSFKRVPVLIWMGKNCEEFERKALSQTLNSSSERDKMKARIESKEWQEEIEQKQTLHFEAALRQALKSRDSELMYICLKEMDMCVKSDELKFHVLKENPVFANHYKNYLKNSIDEIKQKRYIDFLDACRSDFGIEKGFHLLNKSLDINRTKKVEANLQGRQTLLKSALDAMNRKNMEDTFYLEMIDRDLVAMGIHLEQPKDKINSLCIDDLYDWTVYKCVQQALIQDPASVKEHVKIMQVPKHIPDLLKVRNFINSKEYDQLEYFLVNDVNKKTVQIPYELVADLLIRANARENAIRLILNIPKMEEKVNILLKIDEPKRAIQDVINSKKNFDLLQIIRESCRDPEVINYLDNQLAQQIIKK